MELTPQAIRVAGFTTVKRGYDPEEVDAFKARVAAEIEAIEAQAAAMEARARAAVAKLQELTQQGALQRQDAGSSSASGETAPSAPATEPGPPSATEVPDMIARTLLLAQRTADATVADAREEASSIVAEGREEAARLLESARAMAARTVDDARHEARRSAEDERVRIENEVQALLARRDFLVSDVDHLEMYIQAERDRLREAANHLFDLIDRVPGGLGETRRPLLSAAAETDSFWVEPPPAPTDDRDGGDLTQALAADTRAVPAVRPSPTAPDAAAAVDLDGLARQERELVDATVEVLHRLLPDVDAGPSRYDDWDESGPTDAPSTPETAAEPSSVEPAVDGALDPWDDEALPTSSAERSPGSFDDDSFWAMPRVEGDRSFADLSDEIPRPLIGDDDLTVPMVEPTPVNGELRIGGDELR